jgi:hypothetical protein
VEETADLKNRLQCGVHELPPNENGIGHPSRWQPVCLLYQYLPAAFSVALIY